MKRNKLAKKLTAALLTGAMVMSMGGMTAFAEVNSVTAIDLKKTLTADGNTYAPLATFKFDVEIGEAETIKIEGSETGIPVSRGIDGGLELATGKDSISFSATDGIIPGETGLTKTNEDALVVDASVFDQTGVYHYKVSEITTTNYNGITYDTNVTRDVYLYVMDDDGTKYVSNITVASPDDMEKISDVTFVNDYGKTYNTTHDLLVTKQVTGNMGELTKAFDFAVSVSGDEGDSYKVAIKGIDGKETVLENPLVSGAQAVTISIKNGESIHIYGLTDNDQYTVNENSKYAEEEGYSVTNQNNTGTVDVDGKEIIVINHKEVGPATGIAMTFAPYAVMVAFAGVFAVMFLRKKREDF